MQDQMPVMQDQMYDCTGFRHRGPTGLGACEIGADITGLAGGGDSGGFRHSPTACHPGAAATSAVRREAAAPVASAISAIDSGIAGERSQSGFSGGVSPAGN